MFLRKFYKFDILNDILVKEMEKLKFRGYFKFFVLKFFEEGLFYGYGVMVEFEKRYGMF